MSPVPTPDSSAQPPELCREIYGMPMFVSIPCRDLTASSAFWTEGLGFFELFGIPGQMVHLRRWAFQDVLLVGGEPTMDSAVGSVSFACVLDQIEPLLAALRAIGVEAHARDTAWNTRDVEVVTPENARVVFTAAKVFDPDTAEGRALRAVGIGRDDNGQHD